VQEHIKEKKLEENLVIFLELARGETLHTIKPTNALY
jgi:hypothetical protein